MIWNQTYLLFGHGLAYSVAFASLPILTLLLFLGVLRKPAWISALIGLGVTLVLAVGAYHMPVSSALSAAANGAAFGLFPITWIIFWAIILFRVTVETGHFEVIKDSVGSLTPDPRLQALLIAFAFGGFLEGAAGFGAPVAVASTMLVGLGFSSFSAAAICLLANTAPVAFGSIGIPIITLAGTTGLPLEKLSMAVGRIGTPMSFLIPAYLIVAMGGVASLSGIWVPTLLSGGVFAIVQLLVSTYLGPQLTDILAAIATIATLVLWMRLHNARVAAGATSRLSASAGKWTQFARSRMELVSTEAQEPGPLTTRSLTEIVHAWTPYALLVICVLLWGWSPFQALLNRATLTIHWPYLDRLVLRVPPIVVWPTPYPAVYSLNWLAAPGTSCMVATILSAIVLRMKVRDFLRIVGKVMLQLRLPTLTVACMLALAFVMNYCGATATLGLAFSATGRLFPFFSALLGWVGVFLTGSDTSANALFGNLQVVTANHLGFDPVWMAAANSSGGVMGKMISLQTIAVAAAATGMAQAEQSRLFRFTLKHSVLLACTVGVVTMLYTYASHF